MVYPSPYCISVSDRTTEYCYKFNIPARYYYLYKDNDSESQITAKSKA